MTKISWLRLHPPEPGAVSSLSEGRTDPCGPEKRGEDDGIGRDPDPHHVFRDDRGHRRGAALAEEPGAPEDGRHPAHGHREGPAAAGGGVVWIAAGVAVLMIGF